MFKNTNMKAFKNVAKSLFLRTSSFWKLHKLHKRSFNSSASICGIWSSHQEDRTMQTQEGPIEKRWIHPLPSCIKTPSLKAEIHCTKKLSLKMQAWIQKRRLQECAKFTAVPVLENCRNRTLIQFLWEYFAACDLHIKKIEQWRRKKTIYWKTEEEEEKKKRIENLSKFCNKLAASHKAEINRTKNQSLKSEAWTQEQKKAANRVCQNHCSCYQQRGM
jgi:hypothetical protein